MWVLWCHIQWKPNVMLWCSYSLRRSQKWNLSPWYVSSGKRGSKRSSSSRSKQLGPGCHCWIWLERENLTWSQPLLLWDYGLLSFRTGPFPMNNYSEIYGSDESWKLGCLWNHATSVNVTSTQRMENTAISPACWQQGSIAKNYF